MPPPAFGELDRIGSLQASTYSSEVGAEVEAHSISEGTAHGWLAKQARPVFAADAPGRLGRAGFLNLTASPSIRRPARKATLPGKTISASESA